MKLDELIRRLAERYGVSEEAVGCVCQALQRSGGRLAQFSHPDLGGYGQWMPGMTQIGDMFNHGLRDRVDRLCQELSKELIFVHESTSAARTESTATSIPNPMKPMQPMSPMKPMS